MIRLGLAALIASTACRSGSQELSGARLEERWRAVLEAGRPRVPPADPALLERAITVLEPHREAVASDPPILPPEVAGTVIALEAWYDDRGGVPLLSCSDMAAAGRQVLVLATLADLALSTAPAADPMPRVEAVLYLGHRLRQEGRSLLAVMVGSEIADDAVRWATEHHLAPSPAFTELAPADDMLARAVAAEASCMADLIRSLPRGERLLPPEVDKLRRYYIGALDDVSAGGDVTSRLERRTERAQGAGGRVAAVIPSLHRMVARLIEQRQRYHSFLRGIP